MIMVYFERKDYVLRNLYLNCASLWKGFEGLWNRMVRPKCEETLARERRACKYIERALRMFYRVQLFEGLISSYNLGFFFFCSETFLRIIFSVIFKSIQSLTTRGQGIVKKANSWQRFSCNYLLGIPHVDNYWNVFIKWNRFWLVFLTCANIKDPRPHFLWLMPEHNESCWTRVHLHYSSHTFHGNHQSLQWNVCAHWSTTFSVIWSSLLNLVTWVALL